MRLFLLLLHFSLVLVSWQQKVHPNVVHTELKDGFPVGSLLTIFFKYTAQGDWSNSVVIELYEDFEKGTNHLQFTLNDDLEENRNLISAVKKSGKWQDSEDKLWPWKPLGETTRWWRFDLYKINDSKYLSFIDGFISHVRTMNGINKVTSVHLTTHNPDMPNFDKSEVYMNLRLPYKMKDGSIWPKPETILATLDAATVGNDLKKRYDWGVDNFAIGKKIKLSALMQSSPANAAFKDTKDMSKHHATLIFKNKEGTWAFGMCNKYDETTKKVKLHLFSDNAISAGKGVIWPSATNHWKTPMYADCTGSSSSTDILHVKLERPDKVTIKMRIFYKESPAGTTCHITIPNAETAHLEGPLKIVGVQGATLLYVKE